MESVKMYDMKTHEFHESGLFSKVKWNLVKEQDTAIDGVQERTVLKNEIVFGKMKQNLDKKYDMAIDGFQE